MVRRIIKHMLGDWTIGQWLIAYGWIFAVGTLAAVFLYEFAL